MPMTGDLPQTDKTKTIARKIGSSTFVVGNIDSARSVTETTGQKSEARNPKSERSPKSEPESGFFVGGIAWFLRWFFEIVLRTYPLPSRFAGFSDFGLRPSFGFRISDFGALPPAALPIKNVEESTSFSRIVKIVPKLPP